MLLPNLSAPAGHAHHRFAVRQDAPMRPHGLRLNISHAVYREQHQILAESCLVWLRWQTRGTRDEQLVSVNQRFPRQVLIFPSRYQRECNARPMPAVATPERARQQQRRSSLDKPASVA